MPTRHMAISPRSNNRRICWWKLSKVISPLHVLYTKTLALTFATSCQEHLITQVGAPCDVSCKKRGKLAAFTRNRGSGENEAYTAAAFQGDVKACEQACTASKVTKVKSLMTQIRALRLQNGAAVEADNARADAAAKEGKAYRRIYSAIKDGTGSLEAPEQTYTDGNQLHCSVSARTKEVCSMCGGGEAFRFRGYRVELMSPREQRFVPQYPFSTRAEQDMVRRLLRATAAPEAVNTLSLAGHGDIACVSSSPPPRVFHTLVSLGVNLTAWGMSRDEPLELDSRGQALDRWVWMWV